MPGILTLSDLKIDQFVDREVQVMKSELKLSERQVIEIRATQHAFYDSLKALGNKRDIDIRRALFENIQSRKNARLKEILSEDQWKLHEAFLKSRKVELESAIIDRRKSFRERRGI